ncbi:MAG: hypothetical protein ACMUIG_04895 [Thermoplasmatota archaeon]
MRDMVRKMNRAFTRMLSIAVVLTYAVFLSLFSTTYFVQEMVNGSILEQIMMVR